MFLNLSCCLRKFLIYICWRKSWFINRLSLHSHVSLNGHWTSGWQIISYLLKGLLCLISSERYLNELRGWSKFFLLWRTHWCSFEYWVKLCLCVCLLKRINLVIHPLMTFISCVKLLYSSSNFLLKVDFCLLY